MNDDKSSGSSDDENKSVIDSSIAQSAKKVKFQIDSAKSSRSTSPLTLPNDLPDTSTPIKSQSNRARSFSSTASLSHVSSETSLDGVNKYSVYRKYVDKTLRRMGMNKMLIQFNVVLNRTLPTHFFVTHI